MILDRDNLPPLLTVSEVAALLGLHEQTVYRAAWIPKIKVGRSVRIPRDGLIDAIEQQNPKHDEDKNGQSQE